MSRNHKQKLRALNIAKLCKRIYMGLDRSKGGDKSVAYVIDFRNLGFAMYTLPDTTDTPSPPVNDSLSPH